MSPKAVASHVVGAPPVANAALLVAPAPVEKAALPAEVAPTPAPVEEAKPVVTGDAKEEKAKCKKALETRKLAEAIEAGERSVAIDETDGEAWLLLGASYQEKGDLPNARKAYGSCKTLGTASKFTRECAQMLR
jgi:Flp pilus assembly protein TadD